MNNNFAILWIILIVLIVIIFPKSCGFEIPSEKLSYNCLGVNTPILSKIGKADNPQKWCSGICISKLNNITNVETNKTAEAEENSLIPGISKLFIKVIPILFGILLIIALISWITSFKKKSTDIVVYKKN